MKIGAFLILGLVWTMIGCRALPEPVPGKEWKTLSGQVRYHDARRTLVAEVILRSDPVADAYSMEVTKAGASLLKLDRLGTYGWSKGFLGGRSFYGPLREAPANLKSWFAATNLVLKKSLVPTEGGDPDIKIDFRLQP